MKGGYIMNYRLCTLKITNKDGTPYFQTVVLNSKEFKKLIADGAELIEIIN